MGLQSQLNKQIVQHVVLQHELHVAPAVLIIAGFGEVVRIEDAAVKGCTCVRCGFGLLIGLQVLNGIEDIEADMETGS